MRTLGHLMEDLAFHVVHRRHSFSAINSIGDCLLGIFQKALARLQLRSTSAGLPLTIELWNSLIILAQAFGVHGRHRRSIQLQQLPAEPSGAEPPALALRKSARSCGCHVLRPCSFSCQGTGCPSGVACSTSGDLAFVVCALCLSFP